MKQLLTLTLTLLSLGAFAQVGINTTTPSQTLDVNGQIQVGEDINLPEEEGAIRYNSASQDFEGHTANGWQSFTANGAGPLPKGATPVYAKTFFSTSTENLTFIFSESGLAATPSGVIPADKYLVITSILISPRVNSSNFTGTDIRAYDINLTRGTPSGFRSAINYIGRYSHGGPIVNINGLNPIIIYRPNETAGIRSSTYIVGNLTWMEHFSGDLTGFLVDNLNY